MLRQHPLFSVHLAPFLPPFHLSTRCWEVSLRHSEPLFSNSGSKRNKCKTRTRESSVDRPIPLRFSNTRLRRRSWILLWFGCCCCLPIINVALDCGTMFCQVGRCAGKDIRAIPWALICDSTSPHWLKDFQWLTDWLIKICTLCLSAKRSYVAYDPKLSLMRMHC